MQDFFGRAKPWCSSSPRSSLRDRGGVSQGKGGGEGLRWSGCVHSVLALALPCDVEAEHRCPTRTAQGTSRRYTCWFSESLPCSSSSALRCGYATSGLASRIARPPLGPPSVFGIPVLSQLPLPLSGPLYLPCASAAAAVLWGFLTYSLLHIAWHCPSRTLFTSVLCKCHTYIFRRSVGLDPSQMIL
jgi:hypothetical protein